VGEQEAAAGTHRWQTPPVLHSGNLTKPLCPSNDTTAPTGGNWQTGKGTGGELRRSFVEQKDATTNNKSKETFKCQKNFTLSFPSCYSQFWRYSCFHQRCWWRFSDNFLSCIGGYGQLLSPFARKQASSQVGRGWDFFLKSCSRGKLTIQVWLPVAISFRV
jgi:hypothetical protein